MKGLQVHIGKKHGHGSPIPQFDGFSNDLVEYLFEYNAHEVCTDDDVIVVLNTDFHCTLDDEKIGKGDSLRHFDLQKISEGIYRVSAKDDEKIVNIFEILK